VEELPAFGMLLRQYRREQQLTMRELRVRSGDRISIQYIAYLEVGTTRAPSLEYAAIIAEALQLDNYRYQLMLSVALWERHRLDQATYSNLVRHRPLIHQIGAFPEGATDSVADLLFGDLDNRRVTGASRVDLFIDQEDCYLSYVIGELR